MFILSADYWEVKETGHKGRGVFAAKDIPPGTLLGDYIGRVIKTAEEDTVEEDGQLYLMYYHDYASIFPEVDKPGVHLINHSCTPNSWMKVYKGHTLFFTLRHIFAGEEITVSYLLSPKDESCEDDCTHFCHCGSKFCTGTMHLSKKRYDNWNDFELEEEKKNKRQRIRYGKTLPLLPDYPTHIPDHPVFTLFGNAEKEPAVLNQRTLPPVSELRKIMRRTGRTLYFAKNDLHIYGIIDDEPIAKHDMTPDMKYYLSADR